MLNEQLLGYVRDNVRAGFHRADIEASLRGAGWDALDIAAAFTAVEGGAPTPGAVAYAPAAPKNATQQTVDAEVARMQAQFVATHKKQQVAQGGIIGWMMRKHIVSSPTQANMILLGLTAVFALISLWLIFH